MTDREQALEEIDVFCQQLFARAREESELHCERHTELSKGLPDNALSHQGEYFHLAGKHWKCIGSMEAANTVRAKVLGLLNEGDQW